jgi:hypothetical protein
MPEIFYYPAAHVVTNICLNYPVTEAFIITTAPLQDLVARHSELAAISSAHCRRDFRLRAKHVPPSPGMRALRFCGPRKVRERAVS